MNLPSYLGRLGLDLRLPPTLETLRAVHAAHLSAFPFHNLTIQRRGVVDLAIERIEERFFTAGGGGYCFEQNTLLGEALRALGFRVTTLLGRVGPEESRALNHMLLRVDLDGEPWIADVGFGGEGPLEPLPLREGVYPQSDGMVFSLRHDEHHWVLSLGDEPQYEFSGAPHTRGDVEVANHYTATHPASIFRKTLTIQRITPSERTILRPRVITRYRAGAREDVAIEPSELRARARELFGIELGDAPLLFEDVPQVIG
jgi:N-hydroxyarylamine O-acetyltransferase